MSKSNRVEGIYENEFGSFNPGDAVIAITVSTGCLSVSRGTYLGYVEHKGWRNDKRVQVRKKVKRWTPFYKDTSEVARWPYAKDREVGYEYRDAEIVSTLQNNRIIPATVSVDSLIEAL